jgi:alkylhydroperoxidase family enzyme
VNDAPATVSQEDVDRVKAAGWPEEAIYDAATVCAIFNFFNRWIDATGVADVPRTLYESRLAQNGDGGYAM